MPLFSDNLAVSNYLSILDAPASRQLLSNFSSLNYGIDNSIHTSFYDELKAKGVVNSGGYPLNCRNIAISNGAECGIGQGFNPNDDLINYNWDKGLTFGGDLLSMVYLPLGGTIGGFLFDSDFFGVTFVSLIPGKSKYNVEFNAKAMPYGVDNQIYKGRISYTKKILWIGPKITVNITNVQKSQPDGILPLDSYGGGFYNTSIIAGSIAVPNLYIRDKFNFIPTTSALDIGKGNVSLNDSDYKLAYVGATPPVAPKNSPFANFSTDFERFNPNASNKMHISFNSRNGEWLAKELNVNVITTNCSYMCGNPQITGANLLCASATYSVPTGGALYNWTITQGANLVTLTGNGTPSVILTALPDTSGAVTLYLTMGDTEKCGSITLTKTIWVGKPSFYLQYNYFETQPVKSTIDMVSDQPSVAITQQSITSTQFIGIKNGVTIFNSIGNYFAVRATPNKVDKVYAYATNACGTTMVEFDWLNSMRIASNLKEKLEKYYIIYPNPSNDFVNIESSDEHNLPEKETIICGELFDMLGQSKSKVEINNNKATFSVQGLNKGIYVLKIYINNQVESHQIAVE